MGMTKQEIKEYEYIIAFLDSRIKKLNDVVGELQATRNYMSNVLHNTLNDPLSHYGTKENSDGNQ